MNKQIAHELGTTERTIKAHCQQVMEKMEVRSVPEFVSVVERFGFLGSTSDSRERRPNNFQKNGRNRAETEMQPRKEEADRIDPGHIDALRHQ